MTSSIERRRFNALLAKLSVGAYAGTRSNLLFSNEVTQDRLRPNITSGVWAWRNIASGLANPKRPPRSEDLSCGSIQRQMLK